MLTLQQRLELFDPIGYEKFVLNTQPGVSEYDHDLALKKEAEDLNIDLLTGDHLAVHSDQSSVSGAGARSASFSSDHSTSTGQTSLPSSRGSTRAPTSSKSAKRVDWADSSVPAVPPSSGRALHRATSSANRPHESAVKRDSCCELQRAFSSARPCLKSSGYATRRVQSMTFIPSLKKLNSYESVNASTWSPASPFRGLSIRHIIPKFRRSSLSTVRLGVSNLIIAEQRELSLICGVCVDHKIPPGLDQVHQLPCGHCLCTGHLQRLVTNTVVPGNRKSLRRKSETKPVGERPSSMQVPSCCGLPLSNNLLELVVLPAQTNNLASSHQSYIEDVGSRSSPKIQVTAAEDDRLQRQLRLDAAMEAKRNLEAALANPQFRSIRLVHESERDRHLDYRARSFQRFTELKAQHLMELANSHIQIVDSHRETHAPTLNELEESHLRAEEALCQDHEDEARKCRLKTRYQEAYYQDCMDGISGRVLSEEDRRQLAMHRRLAEVLPKKHKDAINVLRAQQAREYQARKQELEDELQQLKQKHAVEIQLLEEYSKLEEDELHNFFKERQERWNHRWALALEIWRIKQSPDTAAVVRYPLAHPEWPEPLRLLNLKADRRPVC